MHWWKHAWAVDPGTPIEPTTGQRAVVERVCREVRRRRLVAPTLLALEMSRPLNYMAAQSMHFLQPFLTVLVDRAAYQQFATFLERRGSIDYLCQQLREAELDEPS